MMNPNNLLDSIRTIAAETAGLIRSAAGDLQCDHIRRKGMHDYVSFVDEKAEHKIVESLQQLIPGAGFLVEEGTAKQEGERYRWIVDPLDGTTNFLHQLPPYSISIALEDHGEIVLGTVYEISADRCYYAQKGKGAFVNNKPIEVSDTQDLNSSLIATGFPFTNFDRMEPFLNCFRYLMQHTSGIRRFGSAAIDLCYLAEGKFDGFYEYNLCPWDVAAGSLILQEAGGRVADFSGGNNHLFGKEIIAANPYLFQDLLTVIQKEFLT